MKLPVHIFRNIFGRVEIPTLISLSEGVGCDLFFGFFQWGKMRMIGVMREH